MHRYQITLLIRWRLALSAFTLNTVTFFSPECQKQIFPKLQCVQDALARVVTRRYDNVKQEVVHIAPVLANLHRLPVKSPVNFKLQTIDTGVQHPSDQFTALPCVTSFRPQASQISAIIVEASTGNHRTNADNFGERSDMQLSQFGIFFSSADDSRTQNNRNIQETYEKLACTTAHTKISELLPTHAHEWLIHIWHIPAEFYVLRTYLECSSGLQQW